MYVASNVMIYQLEQSSMFALVLRGGSDITIHLVMSKNCAIANFPHAVLLLSISLGTCAYLLVWCNAGANYELVHGT